MVMPRRKQNRLPDCDYGRPGYYFITICTRGKRHTLGTAVGADAGALFKTLCHRSVG